MLGDVGTIFPVFQGFWIGFGVIGGMVFYEQGHLIFYKNYEKHVTAGATLVVKWPSVGLYLLAASLIVGGCAVLVIRLTGLVDLPLDTLVTSIGDRLNITTSGLADSSGLGILATALVLSVLLISLLVAAIWHDRPSWTDVQTF